MKNIILFSFLFSIFFISCSDKRNFRVEGSITGAQGEMLYLEELDLEKIQILDSFKLKKSGNFSFKIPRPVYPDFYRVRIKNQTIVFAVDSIEKIEIETNINCFCDDYRIKGSESLKKIKELRLSAIKLEKMINNYVERYDIAEKEIRDKKTEELNKAIEKHKKIAKEIIYKDPRSTAAYYAVFQKLNGLQLFDPYDDEDLKSYAAVATAYSAFYPHSMRGKHLTNLVLQTRKIKRSQELKQILMERSKGVIDITLPDINGENISLSSLKGKVVLLDFVYFSNENPVKHVFDLRNLYQKYKKRGFEIYAVSFDEDYEVFEFISKKIPWICVRDEYSLNSDLLVKYNIDKMPNYFLLNKQGDIVSRHLFIDSDLEANIEKLLKK